MKMVVVIVILCMFGFFFLIELIMKFIFLGWFEGIEILKYLLLLILFIIII